MRVYIRALRAWPDAGAPLEQSVDGAAAPDQARLRFDPRAVALAAAVAFGLLLASTDWALVGAVAVWLACAAALSRPEREPLPGGLALAAVLAGGAFAFGLVGGIGVELAGRRAARAALLVLVATWLRAACGAPGLRHVLRLVLARLAWLPSGREAARTLDALGPERKLLEHGQALVASLRGVRKRPLPVLDAVLGWVAAQALRFRPAPAPLTARLSAGPADALLVVLALVPALLL